MFKIFHPNKINIYKLNSSLKCNFIHLLQINLASYNHKINLLLIVRQLTIVNNLNIFFFYFDRTAFYLIYYYYLYRLKSKQ